MTAELDQAAFIEWASKRAIPLERSVARDDFSRIAGIDRIVGNFRIVAIGECQHYVREFCSFRAELFKYLVQEKGFRAFVFECNLVESKAAYDYVLGKHDNLDLAAAGVGPVFGLWETMQALLRWMRDFNNNKHDDNKIRFYGMDGSEFWNSSETAVRNVLEYLSAVDPEFAISARNQLSDLPSRVNLRSIETVSSADAEKLICELSALVARFQAEQLEYLRKSGKDDFDWAVRALAVARQIGVLLLAVHRNPGERERIWWNIRDACMAENLQWIIEREGMDAGFVIGAHNIHLQNAFGRESNFDQTSMMQVLRAKVSEYDMLTISGTGFHSIKPDDDAIAESIQSAFSKVGPSSYLLDLRGVDESAEAKAWLDKERLDRSNMMYQPVNYHRAWHAVYFCRDVGLDAPQIPSHLKRPRVTVKGDVLARLVGNYYLEGVASQWVKLAVTVSGDHLVTDGYESDGELFPMHSSRLFPISDCEFCWADWPLVLKFECDRSGLATAIHISEPGSKWHYRGEKRE